MLLEKNPGGLITRKIAESARSNKSSRLFLISDSRDCEQKMGALTTFRACIRISDRLLLHTRNDQALGRSQNDER